MTFLASLNEGGILTRLRSRKINNSCSPSKAQRAYHNPSLPSGSAYIYEDIHVRRCTFGLLKCTHYFRGWFRRQTCLPASNRAECSSKPARAGGIRDAEVKSSPQYRDGFRSWRRWAGEPRWCRVKSWATAEVGAVLSVAACLQLREHSVALGQWEIIDLLFLLYAEAFKPGATIIWSHQCVSVLIIIQSELAQAAWSGIQYRTIIQ